MAKFKSRTLVLFAFHRNSGDQPRWTKCWSQPNDTWRSKGKMFPWWYGSLANRIKLTYNIKGDPIECRGDLMKWKYDPIIHASWCNCNFVLNTHLSTSFPGSLSFANVLNKIRFSSLEDVKLNCPNIALSHWLVRDHMTLKNKTVPRQKPLNGLHCKNLCREM